MSQTCTITDIATRFLATFPVVIPFIFLSDAKLALRASYAVAIVSFFAAVTCSDIIAGSAVDGGLSDGGRW